MGDTKNSGYYTDNHFSIHRNTNKLGLNFSDLAEYYSILLGRYYWFKFLLFFLVCLATFSCGGGEREGSSSPFERSPSEGVLFNLSHLGITNFTFTPSNNSITLHWTNPAAPPKGVHRYEIVLSGYANIHDEFPSYTDSIFPNYRGNGNIQRETFSNINASYVYEVDIGFVYFDNSKSDLAVAFAKRRAVGRNADGDEQIDDEDKDDDNDKVKDAYDSCPTGEMGWISNKSTDNDGDGCRDAGEDEDDDNDKVKDAYDSCPTGEVGWISNTSTDNDGDGCRDAGEDEDDDNDKVKDAYDSCSTGEVGWISNANTDNDGDGCRDAGEDEDDDNDNYPDTLDVDGDGDGLIEIATEEMFNWIRNNLAGTSLISSRGGPGNVSGCGNGTRAGIDIISCSGYELVADISLTDYDSWNPIGSCVNYHDCPDAFVGVLEGNHHSISDLKIDVPLTTYGVGLFGAVNSPASLRNLNLLNVSITSNSTSYYFGGVVGYAKRASFSNIFMGHINISAPSVDTIGGIFGRGDYTNISGSSVQGINIEGDGALGGLIGDGYLARISGSSVQRINIRGDGDLGGLVGYGDDINISDSSVIGVNIVGDYNLGGLLGAGDNAVVSGSSVIGVNIVGDDDLGGLIGDSYLVRISGSSVTEVDINGTDALGGLLGYGDNAVVLNSSVEGVNIEGDSDLGGLIGDGYLDRISGSSVIGVNIDGVDNLGGLLGYGDNAVVSGSSVIGVNINGDDDLGGLIGDGYLARISGSSVIGVNIDGDQSLGGLVGDGEDAIILDSSVVVMAISGNRSIGGLVGEGIDTQINSSLVLGKSIVAVSHVGGIVGVTGMLNNVDYDPQSVINSYWLDSITFTNAPPLLSNTFGDRKTTMELQLPAVFSHIYADWDNSWCDPTTGKYMIRDTIPQDENYVRVWDLGGYNEYPVIRCLSLTPAQQRTIINQVLSDDPPSLNQ